MPRRTAVNDDWADDGDDDADADDNGDAETVPCPHCRQPVYEEAEQCPHCGSYISSEDAPRARKAWWIILGTMLCLYAIYRWIAG